MKAAVVQKPQSPIVIEDRPMHEPKSGEVLIRVHACGVCHSDLMVQQGLPTRWTKTPPPQARAFLWGAWTWGARHLFSRRAQEIWSATTPLACEIGRAH